MAGSLEGKKRSKVDKWIGVCGGDEASARVSVFILSSQWTSRLERKVQPLDEICSTFSIDHQQNVINV